MKRFVFMCVALLMCVVSVFAETSVSVFITIEQPKLIRNIRV